MSKHDMSVRFSKLDHQSLNHFCLKYAIDPQYKSTPPLPHHRITDCPDGCYAFQKPWRQPDDELNVVDPCYEKFDTDLYGLLVKHSTPLQCFPEHVLIMTGLSRNWPYVSAEPIIKDGDEEISLLKYMENKDLGDVKLTSRFLAEHEDNIFDRTQGICYEGGPTRERMPETEMVAKKMEYCGRGIQVSWYRMRMTLQHRKKSSTPAKGRKMAAKKTIKVVEALQKELGDARAEGEERLKVEREMVERLNGELKVERREKLWLQKSLERVSSERQWLIQEGFEYVINRLHRSQEYLKPLGAVMSKLWSSEAHDGVVEGYACCKAGVDLEHLGLYKPKAEEFRKAADELEHMRFPYVVALSQSTEGTLDDLKALEPEAMDEEEDEVAAAGGGDQTNR
ncbi:hypothetical protein L1987_39231 [Smallanthus sonchifolius]|uniref:Uncharacterized protein n=1 Tax=Smallanthus sonchifolius TaxID=185202 RepID=A0ACB9HMT0_9ASTR|nr:hypothetical protein L1987_39231 [Smallanthus sonchifolius]